jgi:hypothetical protein
VNVDAAALGHQAAEGALAARRRGHEQDRGPRAPAPGREQ